MGGAPRACHRTVHFFFLSLSSRDWIIHEEIIIIYLSSVLTCVKIAAHIWSAVIIIQYDLFWLLVALAARACTDGSGAGESSKSCSGVGESICINWNVQAIKVLDTQKSSSLMKRHKISDFLNILIIVNETFPSCLKTSPRKALAHIAALISEAHLGILRQ